MESKQLIDWLNEPAILDGESLVEIKETLDVYPCFTTLRMLYLKNLLNTKDVRFSTELVRTAISVPDRRRLFLFMEDRLEECLPGFQPQQAEAGDHFSLIDRYLQHASEFKEEEDTWIPSTDVEDVQEAVSGKKVETDEVVDEFGLAGFSLNYLEFQQLYPKKEGDEEQPTSRLRGQELIDAFLEKQQVSNPVMTGSEASEYASTEVNDSSAELDQVIEEGRVDALLDTLPEDSFSEALAKIYLKQKRYDKALEIIKSLRLKNPEKNTYFADQIRFLEKLIINTKQ